MINIYKIRINIISKILLFGLMLAIQSCSNSDIVIDKNLQQGTGQNSNRRAPEGNLAGEQSLEQTTDTSLKRVDKDYDAYQNYQSNDAPVSLSDLKKLKRHPVLNARELGSTHRRKAVKAKKKAKTPNVDGNCNLQEVINYNKQQQKTDAVSTVSPASAPVATKAPEVKDVSSKPAITNIAPKAAVVAMPIKDNPSTKNEVKTVNTEKKKQQDKSEQAILPKVSLPELKEIQQKTSETIVNPEVKAVPVMSTTMPVSAPVSATVITPTTVTTSVPSPTAKAPAPVVNIPAAMAKSVLVPIPPAAAPITAPMPATKPMLMPAPLSSTNLKVAPPISAPADITKDVSNLSQDDLEKMLKDKFAKSRSKEFIDDSQGNASPPAQFNKNLLNEDEMNEDIVQSSSSSPAVSKIRAFYKESRLSKINTLLISYYFQVKHQITSLFFGDDI